MESMARELEVGNTWAPLGAAIELSVRMNATLAERYPNAKRRKHRAGDDVFVVEGTPTEIAEALKTTAYGTDGDRTVSEAARSLAEDLLDELDANDASGATGITIVARKGPEERPDAGTTHERG